ncbi:MAG: PDZ domain-containing protein [Chloroflexi bacterium]|nr:PDZ domain-containing protein [Chloroflexota bacterium]
MRKFAVYGASALLVLSSAVGISFAQDTATPAPSATDVAAPAQRPARIWLGVSVSDDGTGVTIQRVSPGSPAEAAQLQANDVILSVNGTTVDTADELRAIIDAAASGDVVTLSVQRGTETLSIEATLATTSGRIGMGMGPGAPALPTDSLQAAEWVLHVQLEAVDGGYQVTAVNPNDDDNTLVVGDVITQVNGTDIASLDWTTLMTPPTANTAAPTLTLTVLRDGTETTVEAQLHQFMGRGGRDGFGGQPGNGGPGGRGGNNGRPDGNGGPNGNNGDDNGALPALPGNGSSNTLPPLPGNGSNQPTTPGNGNGQPSGGSI